VAGSLLAGKLHRVGDLTWTRRYGWAMATAVLGLGLLGGAAGLAVVVGALVAAGVFAGLLLVPLNAALQSEANPTHLGKTIAIQNFVDYCAMLAGAGFIGALTAVNAGPRPLFIALAAALGMLAFLLKFPSPARPAGPLPAVPEAGAP
jgi:LPLT family lysophospholipid transporter-like MFS transporter